MEQGTKITVMLQVSCLHVRRANSRSQLAKGSKRTIRRGMRKLYASMKMHCMGQESFELSHLQPSNSFQVAHFVRELTAQSKRTWCAKNKNVWRSNENPNHLPERSKKNLLKQAKANKAELDRNLSGLWAGLTSEPTLCSTTCLKVWNSEVALKAIKIQTQREPARGTFAVQSGLFLLQTGVLDSYICRASRSNVKAAIRSIVSLQVNHRLFEAVATHNLQNSWDLRLPSKERSTERLASRHGSILTGLFQGMFVSFHISQCLRSLHPSLFRIAGLQ